MSLPLTAFQMPDDVHKQLESEGCLVAQSNLAAAPHNVLHGEFAAPGQEDWMAVCRTDEGTVQARFVWGGPHRCETPLANDMVIRSEVGGVRFRIVPYFTVGLARESENHKRLLQRWTPSGGWSYYCKDGQWQKTAGDSCNKTARNERPPSRSSLKLPEQELNRRRNFKEVAAAELQETISKLAPRQIPLTSGDANCMPIASLRQQCFFQLSGNESMTAHVIVERIGKQAWFATSVEATFCQIR
jgi:hypothetical protein